MKFKYTERRVNGKGAPQPNICRLPIHIWWSGNFPKPQGRRNCVNRVTFRLYWFGG